MPKSKQKIKYTLSEFVQDHPRLSIFGILIILIIYTLIFFAIITGISKITGFKYSDKGLVAMGSSLLLIGLAWFATKENSWLLLQNNRARFKINILLSLLAIILLILTFII